MVLKNYPLFGVFARGNYWDVIPATWVYRGIHNSSRMAQEIAKSRPRHVLRINVREEYFKQIKSGEKTEEYREIKPFWTKALRDRHYDFVVILLGYPSRNEKGKWLIFPYTGYTCKTITHPEFGDKPVKVYAIKLSKDPARIPAAL